MKRILVTIIMCTILVFPSTIGFANVGDNKLNSVSAIVNKNDAKKIVANHVIREKHNAEFKDWINGEVDDGTELVDFNNNVIAYLFNVYDKTALLGYSKR
ncbi:hypothetical protein V6B95_13960 [Thermoanaerobacterium saccharolyticum]|uniref:hypothetical protein n=1 Tax=Thermoanaerobacterium saccharolyticum TaxID=28896 RepID=UPI0005ED8BBE